METQKSNLTAPQKKILADVWPSKLANIHNHLERIGSDVDYEFLRARLHQLAAQDEQPSVALKACELLLTQSMTISSGPESRDETLHLTAEEEAALLDFLREAKLDP